jgi:23S rRNA (adenine2503-C2)-methyltransferase
LSTSGIVPNIEAVATELGVKLAISLHAPNNEKRSQIMPINDRYKIEEILEACQKYQAVMGMSRMITFEYLMLKDFNDSEADAQELIALMKKYRLGAKFNLIPFNPWPGCSFQPSSNNRVHAFSRMLEAAGFEAPIRVARGQDILAACGQLKSKHNNA